MTETVEGSWELLDQVLAGANTEVDPEGEERKGGAGALGKLFLSASVQALLFSFHVPAELSELLSLQEWYDEVAAPLGAVILSRDETHIRAEAKGDASKELFPLKMRDSAVNTSFGLLRKKKLVLDDEEDEVDLSALQEAAGTLALAFVGRLASPFSCSFFLTPAGIEW